MPIFHCLIFSLIMTFLTFLSTFSIAQSEENYKSFSKIIIKVDGKESFDTIIAYNEFYHLNPKTAKFKLLFNDEICIGKMIIRKPSTFKFICSSGYNAQGVYYPTNNAVDAFGKGVDSEGKKLSFRLEGAKNSLKKKFKRILIKYDIRDKKICERATTYHRPDNLVWRNENIFNEVKEAKNRNLTLKKCEVILLSNLDNNKLCQFSTTKIGNNYFWDTEKYFSHVNEAKRRGLDCGVNKMRQISSESGQSSSANQLAENDYFKYFKKKNYKIPYKEISKNITKVIDYLKMDTENESLYLFEDNVSKDGDFVLINPKSNIALLHMPMKTNNSYFQKIVNNNNIKNFSFSINNTDVHSEKKSEYDNYSSYEWINPRDFKKIKLEGEGYFLIKDRLVKTHKYEEDLFLSIGITDGKFWTSETFTMTGVINSKKPNISSAELDSERQKRIELERKLAALESKQKQEQQRISSDNQEPKINAFTKQDGSNVVISGRVTDDTELAEVLVDGQAQQLKSNGTFETNFYIPRTGKTIEIVAYDIKGNKASKFLKLERDNIQQANVQKFKSLNPSLKTVKSNPNALALIIGISDYENTKASALYADSDAKMFYDYANLKLGIPSSNIKELVGNDAKRLDIFKSVRSYLLKRTVTDKTDIYVFFAGHGLATDDGKGMYLLPYDGDPEYLEDSAIKRKKLFTDIQATKPRSVTVFLDTCYSGGTRNEETLVASLRPIIITAKEQSIPSNFTVLSAAKGNQTSQSLEEVKHGLFSYYMMLGMEGGADANNDNKITARELHSFVVDKVERQSQFRQTPELQGNKDRVLVQFN